MNSLAFHCGFWDRYWDRLV
uniref:Uncharacterized protein n=1 Tax=Anguilla anguilla TaxID=7936 RepID=A0A0E9QGF4_ANGAN